MFLEDPNENELSVELGAQPEESMATPETKVESAQDKSQKPVDEDPEFEVDAADEAGKPTKQKLKLSELKKGYLRESDYTRKTQEISALKERYRNVEEFLTRVNSHDGLRKLINSIVVKAGLDEGKINDEVVNKYLGLIEDKKEAIVDDQKEIESVLSELDPDGPHYKILKRQLEQNKEQLKKIAALEQKISGFDKFQTTLTEQQQNEQLQKATTEAATVMETTLKDLADTSKGGYKFIHDTEKQRWESTVNAILKTIQWPQNTTLDMFRDAIKKAGKTAFDHITREREAYQAAFLGSKKQDQAATPAKSKAPAVDTADMNDDEKALLNALNDS